MKQLTLVAIVVSLLLTGCTPPQQPAPPKPAPPVPTAK